MGKGVEREGAQLWKGRCGKEGHAVGELAHHIRCGASRVLKVGAAEACGEQPLHRAREELGIEIEVGRLIDLREAIRGPSEGHPRAV